MAAPDSQPSSDQQKLPADFRPRPSRNQKRRSKLQQIVDEPAESPVENPPPPPSPPPPQPPSLRRNRLKRSGHMHEDLLRPPADAPAPPEEEY